MSVNQNQQNHQKYQRVPEPGDPTQSEAWALTQAAIRIRQAYENKDTEGAEVAVRLNWRLWTIFQSEMLSPNCPLPANIRQNILSLAAFIDKRSIDFYAEKDMELLPVMFNINKEIASGLYDSIQLTNQEASSSATENTQTEAAPAGFDGDIEA